jgi:hypothetical protein
VEFVYLETGGFGVVGEGVVYPAQLGIDFQANVAHHLHMSSYNTIRSNSSTVTNLPYLQVKKEENVWKLSAIKKMNRKGGKKITIQSTVDI